MHRAIRLYAQQILYAVHHTLCVHCDACLSLIYVCAFLYWCACACVCVFGGHRQLNMLIHNQLIS